MDRAIYLLSPMIYEGTISLPMIQFKIIADSIDFSSCDTLMFTSKEAVKSANILDIAWKDYPCLAIGSATAKQIIELGGKVEYHPSSFYGQTLSQDILEKFKNRKILYLRPKVISFDSKSFLAKSNIILDEQIIYETTCVDYQEKEQPSKNAIIVFTSPSTIKCFFKSFRWDESYTAIVIGESTKEHLAENIYYEIADEPTIKACIAKAKALE